MVDWPTLDDEAMRLFSDHIRNDFDYEIAPMELHLPDCAIPAHGFHSLMEAIEDTGLYPRHNGDAGDGIPLYLRSGWPIA